MNLLFDLDGTLTDPRIGIVRCMRHALITMGVEPPPAAVLERYIGPSLFKSFVELLGTDDRREIDRAVAHYRERFTDTGIYENRTHAGIRTILEHFQQAEHSMLVVTTKPTVFARRIVEHFSIADRFRDVIGANLDGSRSDKADLISYALEIHGMRAADTLMIGDRRDDVLGAVTTHVYPVGVLWGFGTRSELVEAGARQLCERPEELPAAVGISEGRRR